MSFSACPYAFPVLTAFPMTDGLHTQQPFTFPLVPLSELNMAFLYACY